MAKIIVKKRSQRGISSKSPNMLSKKKAPEKLQLMILQVCNKRNGKETVNICFTDKNVASVKYKKSEYIAVTKTLSPYSIRMLLFKLFHPTISDLKITCTYLKKNVNKSVLEKFEQWCYENWKILFAISVYLVFILLSVIAILLKGK